LEAWFDNAIEVPVRTGRRLKVGTDADRVDETFATAGLNRSGERLGRRQGGGQKTENPTKGR
jgi:hypothetical protein